ncbi:MAG TPA: thioredoxin [Propionicimonas sp.]|nr:thioredoxin [Propionicimonas sp.]HRA07607.1 thioredoxin [Propionicimonas sp.]
MANVADVTDATFADQVLASPKPVLVDYWADWCAPCKQLSPIIDELARDYGDSVTFLKLDTNTNTATPVNYGVLSLPTIQIWVGGEVVKSFTGAKPKSVLLKAIEEFI